MRKASRLDLTEDDEALEVATHNNDAAIMAWEEEEDDDDASTLSSLLRRGEALVMTARLPPPSLQPKRSQQQQEIPVDNNDNDYVEIIEVNREQGASASTGNQPINILPNTFSDTL